MKFLNKYIEFFSAFPKVDLNVYKTEFSDDDFKNVIFLLERDCKPFLDEICKVGSRVLFRGFYTDNVNSPIVKLNVNKNRKSKNIPLVISELLDNLFYKFFKVRPRSQGVFVTKEVYVAKGYGRPCIFFPIGEYKYLWSPNIEDLHVSLEETDVYYNDDIDEVEDNLTEILDGYIDSNIEDCFSQEMVFICDNYYLVNISFLDKLQKYLINRKRNPSL